MADEKRRRWWRWPLTWAGTLVLGLVLVPAFDYADLDPLYRFAAQWAAFALFVLGAGGLFGWFFFRSGLSARPRLVAAAVLAVGVAAFLGSLSGFDVTGDFAFLPRF